MNKKKVLSYLILSAIVLGGGVYMSQASVQHTQPAPDVDAPVAPRYPVVSVKTVQLQPGALSLSASGTFEAAKNIRLYANLGSTVEQILRPPGTPVNAGDLLAKLDNRDLKERQRAMQSQVTTSQRDLTAAQSLYQRKLLAKQDLLQKQEAYRVAQSSLKQINIQLEDMVIRAPFDGVLERKFVTEGEWVKSGDPLFQLIQAAPMKATVKVAEADWGQVQLGQRATLYSRQGHTLDGTVTHLYQQLSDATRMGDVEITLTAQDNLPPIGSSARAELFYQTVQYVAVSPAHIDLTAGTPSVKVLRDNRVAQQPVQVVKMAPDGFWLSGLRTGDQLITQGGWKVRAGERVEVSE